MAPNLLKPPMLGCEARISGRTTDRELQDAGGGRPPTKLDSCSPMESLEMLDTWTSKVPKNMAKIEGALAIVLGTLEVQFRPQQLRAGQVFHSYFPF